jgi:hypothetical protein
LLGIETRPDNGHYYGSGHWSLAFRFNLHMVPTATPPTAFIKAQVIYQTPNLRLTDKLSAWVKTLPHAPDDLLISCFILEDNRDRHQAVDFDWLWFQTGPTLLHPDQWTPVNCPASSFAPSYTGGHWINPLLVGFEFTRRENKGAYDDTVYLDKIVLR